MPLKCAKKKWNISCLIGYLLTYAVVEPLAVVVKVRHALVAGAAVLGAFSRDLQSAQVAVSVLDDVLVLGAVQFRQR